MPPHESRRAGAGHGAQRRRGEQDAEPETAQARFIAGKRGHQRLLGQDDATAIRLEEQGILEVLSRLPRDLTVV